MINSHNLNIHLNFLLYILQSTLDMKLNLSLKVKMQISSQHKYSDKTYYYYYT